MSTDSKPRVYLRTPLSAYSGYGNDGIGIVQALIGAGADVFVEPTSVQFPIPEKVMSHVNRLTEPPFDIALVHLDPAQLSIGPKARQTSTLVIGWTMWEWSDLSALNVLNEGALAIDEHVFYALDHARRAKKPGGIDLALVEEDKREAVAEAAEKIRETLADFDVLVGYDQNTCDGLAAFFDGPIVKVQGGYNAAAWPKVERDWSTKEFYFCQIGVLSDRKNPLATLAAFGIAKEKDPQFNRWARLMMKNSLMGMHPKMLDIFGEETDPETGETYQSVRVFTDSWPVEVIQAFYKSAHVLLAPSRGEGKNMPALEFLSSGGTVMATDWGGHREWLNDDYSYRIPYTLIAEDSKYPTSMNAEVDVEAYADLMLEAFHNRFKVRQKGEVAAGVIPIMCDWSAVMERLLSRATRAVGTEAGTRAAEAVSRLEWHRVPE